MWRLSRLLDSQAEDPKDLVHEFQCRLLEALASCFGEPVEGLMSGLLLVATVDPHQELPLCLACTLEVPGDLSERSAAHFLVGSHAVAYLDEPGV